MIVKFDLTSCHVLNHMICLYFISKYLIKQGSKDYLMENVEKRPVKLIANFVKFVKNKASQDNFPYDNISKSMTIATSIFWKDWDKVKTNQEQRMKFLTRIEQEAKELEINGFLHNSRGTNKIDSTSSNTQQE